MSDAKRDHPQGICSVCDRKIALTKGGMVNRHGAGTLGVWPPEICKGFGKPPREEH